MWRTCSLMSAKSELPASPAAQQHLMTENTRQLHRKANMSRSQQRPKRKWREWSPRRGSRKQRREGKRVMQESTRSETGGLWRRRSRENGREFAESETERKRRRGNVRGGSEPRWTERAQMLSDHLIGRRKPGEVESRTAPALTPGGWDTKQPFICHLCLQLLCRVRTALKSRLCPVLQ